MPYGTREHHANLAEESLAQAMNCYLHDLHQHAPEKLHRSSTRLFTLLLQHHLDPEIPFTDLELRDIADTVADSYEKNGVKSCLFKLRRLSDFLAYVNRSHPLDEELQIIHALPQSDHENSDELYEDLRSHKDYRLPEPEEEHVEEIIEYIRSNQRGNPSHIAIELILDTRSRIQPILDVQHRDFQPEDRCLRIPIPDQFAISKYGLMTHRSCTISQDTCELFSQYLRTCPGPSEQSGGQRLLTATPRGALSAIYRSLRAAETECAIPATAEHDAGVSTTTEPKVGPAHVRRYALAQRYSWQD